MKNDGGPAFPYDEIKEIPGMSLRDWFAGQALQPLLRADVPSGDLELVKAIPEVAYRIADAMLAEREKRNDPPS